MFGVHTIMCGEGGRWCVVGRLARIGDGLLETFPDILMELGSLGEKLGVLDGLGHVAQDAKVGGKVNKSVKPGCILSMSEGLEEMNWWGCQKFMGV